ILERELGISIEWSQSGCAVGTVLHPDAILKAVEFLISQGADAAGGLSVIHGVTAEMFAKHMDGKISNPSGGVEAIITHLISKVFRSTGIPMDHPSATKYIKAMDRDTVITKLRARESELRRLGVQSLSLFGSLATGRNTETSD